MKSAAASTSEFVLAAVLVLLTAFPFGIVVPGVDLPNTFPHIIAIERLVVSGVETPATITVLAGYPAIYCLPCLILLALGRRRGDRVHARLQPLYNWFESGRLCFTNGRF